jgi:hypothetical protein
MKDFYFSFLATLVCLILAAWWGEAHGISMLAAIWIVCVLGILEISLSFENAVVNASILKDMDALWQTLFLTLGIFIAVFGMRLVFPIVIVAVATGLDTMSVIQMALDNPEEYARHLEDSNAGISAFGGTFLLLIFLSFIFNADRKLHWLGKAEEKLAQLGKVRAIDILIVLTVLLCLYKWLPLEDKDRMTVLAAGLLGAVLFIALNSLDHFFRKEGSGESSDVGKAVRRNGLTAFLYLEVLDASFSFDGVIGAFAISRDVVIIMLGLAIGAVFVRSMTIHLVHRGTLEHYVFLEHGAHYAIGALAIIMLIGITAHPPALVTGLIGVIFIALSLISSVRYRARSCGQRQNSS